MVLNLPLMRITITGSRTEDEQVGQHALARQLGRIESRLFDVEDHRQQSSSSRDSRLVFWAPNLVLVVVASAS